MRLLLAVAVLVLMGVAIAFIGGFISQTQAVDTAARVIAIIAVLGVGGLVLKKLLSK